MKCISWRRRANTFTFSRLFLFAALLLRKFFFALFQEWLYTHVHARSHPGPRASRERNTWKKMEEETQESGCGCGCSLKQYLPSTRNPYSLINISWWCNSKEEHGSSTHHETLSESLAEKWSESGIFTLIYSKELIGSRVETLLRMY